MVPIGQNASKQSGCCEVIEIVLKEIYTYFIRELKYRRYRQLIRLWHLEIHGQTVSRVRESPSLPVGGGLGLGAVTKISRAGQLKQKNIFLTVLEAGQSRIKTPADSEPGGSPHPGS